MQDDFSTRSIYLRKDGEPGYIGLHSTGMYAEDGHWASLEAWANGYDENKKFQASLWRMFGQIEETAREMIAAGWVEVERFENEL